MDKILSGSQLIIEGDSSVQSCVGEFISGGQGWTQNGPIDIINNKLIVDFPVGSSTLLSWLLRYLLDYLIQTSTILHPISISHLMVDSYTMMLV